MELVCPPQEEENIYKPYIYSGKKKYVNLLEFHGFRNKFVIKCDLKKSRLPVGTPLRWPDSGKLSVNPK